MHSQSVAGGNTNNNVTEDQGTGGVQLNGNDVLVCNAECFSISGGHVNVTLCDDNALSQSNFACGTNQLQTGSACNVAAFAEGYNDLISAIWNGKPAFAVNSETLISDGLKILPTANIAADYLRQISETREYIINSCLSAFGVHANTILKRERSLTAEIDLQTERPTFNIYTMLAEREKLAKRLAGFFNYPVSVKLNPILNQYDNTDRQVMNAETKTGDARRAAKAALNAEYGLSAVEYMDTDSIKIKTKEGKENESAESETRNENNN